jgi:glycosyltransferase involved in cell wall biosynthesis
MSRILFLSRWFPYPPGNGSKLRIYHLLRALATRHEVTLLSFNDQPDKPVDVTGLEAICEAVHVIPWRPYNPASNRARSGYFTNTPRFLIDTFSPAMQHCLEETLAHGRTDLIIASQIDMAAYAPFFGGVPALFEEAEVGTLYEQFVHASSWKGKGRYGLTWSKHRRYLAGLLQKFRACTVVSAQEKALLETAVSPHIPIEIIPNCINLNDYNEVCKTAVPNTLIFTGSFTYEPNYEAMCWFLQEVFPLVRAQIPDAHLTITGNHANRPLPTLENVTLSGFVADIRPYLARSWVSLVPIWTGGGTRLKILEAMALRTPVIATTKGAEGLTAVDGKQLLMADGEEEFATAVIQLLQNPTLRQQLAQNGYDLVKRQYDWSVIAPCFLKVVERAACA